MKSKKTILQIPVEAQIRELDAKLLLACVAANRGFSAVIGSRQELKSRIAFFPRSIYIAKDLRSGSRHRFKIMRKLGCEIVAWDEEGLIHDSPEIYYETRLSPASIKHVSHLFAWGRNNAELWHQYPELPTGIPIHITGNPRGDLLRPEMRIYYENRVKDLHDAYGNFVLINTNFVGVNAIVPVQNFFLPNNEPGEKTRLGRGAGEGMSRKYAEGLRAHTQAVFEDFKQLIPALEQAFPNLVIVVRPHPGENPKIYNEIAAQCERVRVTNEGSVIPWLMATKAVVHNGCTTGVEACAMGVPVVAYRATVNEYFDNRLFQIPNMLSHQCFDFEELRATLGKIAAGDLGAPDGEERKALFDHHLAAWHGPLACERIVDVLEKMLNGRSELPKPVLGDRLKGHFKAIRRDWKKRYKAYLRGASEQLELQSHLYPGISLEEMRVKMSRFQQLLGDDRELKVEQIFNQLFRISG